MRIVALAVLLVACKPATGPVPDAEAGAIVEAGVAVASGVCSLLEGIDSDGTLRSVCATVEEIAQVVAFILTLRSSDAGAPSSCATLPGTSFCATSTERAKGALFVSKYRAARLTIDGGK